MTLLPSTPLLRILPLLLFSGSAAAALDGSWQCNGSDGRHSLNFQNGNTLLYDNEPLSYMEMGNMLVVQDDEGMSNYGFQLQGKALTIQFPDGSQLNCTRGSASAPAQPSAAGPAAAPAGGGVDSATLAAQIAGTWWGYAGSTERKIGLCPDGSYLDYTESGYSGREYDSGGYQTGAWGSASQSGTRGRWTIQGNYQQGVISVQSSRGPFTLHYSQVGEPGCLNINGNRLCRSSASCN